MIPRTVFHGLPQLPVILLAAASAAAMPPAMAGDGHDAHPSAPKAADTTPMPTLMAGKNTLQINPERLQAIGVKFEPAARRDLDRTIRTVGRVEIDERRLAHVNIKLGGWIDKLYVNYTGAPVRQGQVIFNLYSPELIATQEEYLLALRSARDLGNSVYPEVAQGARSMVDVSRRRLQLWDIREEHIRDLEETGKVLRTLPIHSPITGTVIKKTAVEGMHVNAGDELYTIADLNRMWIVGDIYEYELPFIKVGQRARLTLSYDPGTALEALVDFIYPTINPESRTTRVRFDFDNADGRLKPDMYTNIEIKVPLGNRLVVPKDAVLESGERRIIFIHHGEGKLEWRTVTIGARADDWMEILQGLAEGEHIVTSANFLLDSESQLRSAVGAMKH